jgi:DNA-binding MarR family transcriptional regulator
MSLKKELGLKNPFASFPHEALLNIYHTASLLRKKSTDFFRKFEITDVQFNVLNLLYYQGGDENGLSQVELSRMLLVNRSNITSLIDRMEKAEIVKRNCVSGDRRVNMVQLTSKGKKKFEDVEPDYAEEVERIMNILGLHDQKNLVKFLEKIRMQIS